MKKILASTFHALPGQERAWIAQFDLAFPILSKLYDAIYISATALTEKTCVPSKPTKSLLESLSEYGARCAVVDAGLGDNHRAALRMAAEDVADNQVRIHYCDFDRILVWSQYYPDELQKTLGLSEWFLALFPSRRGLWNRNPEEKRIIKDAWESHPITQKATEVVVDCVVNSVFNHITLGKVRERARFDPLGTSQITTPELARALCEQSTFAGFPQAEWTAIVIGEMLQDSDIDVSDLGWIEVDGLLFETHELYRQDKSESDLRKAFMDLEMDKHEALKRIGIAEAMIESFVGVLRSRSLIDTESSAFVRELTKSLVDLKARIEKSPAGDAITNMLNNFYVNFECAL